MVDWRNINEHQSYAKIRRELAKRITAGNYGFDSDNWNLRELIQEGTQMGTICMQIIAGESQNGRREGQMLEDYVENPNGTPGGFPFRLKVLTRQACKLAADGKWINGWSAGNKCKHEERPDNTLFPEHAEPPEKGDEVWVKRGYLKNLTPQKRNAMLARGESPIIWGKKKVDADGCIWCDYGEASQLLHRGGKRVVFPEFRRPDRHLENLAKEGKGDMPREITQWHFEEVSHNYKAPRKRKPKKEEDAQDSKDN